MRITTRGRYALRAALAMARLSKNGTPISIRRLSEEEEISPVFLEQIFYKLRKSGLVKSVRGPGGGFIFSKDLSSLTIKDILDAAGEGVQLAPCSNTTANCSKRDACIAHQIWADATQAINDYFASQNFQAINERFGKLSNEAPNRNID